MFYIQKLGHFWIHFLRVLGKSGIILFLILFNRSQVRQPWSLLIRQLYSVGFQSVIIIVMSGLFIGMVLALQGFRILSDFGSEEAVGQLVSLSLLRELGPVVTALLFAGRAGSALTAEIGLMKATEQISMMEMIGVDPIKRIVAPRFWAGLISMPLLSCLFNVVGIFGAVLVGVNLLGIYEGAFWSHIHSSVDFVNDILNGLVKSFIFGIAVSWVAVFQGHESIPTSEGISQATTKTVVYSSLLILALDFLLTAIMFGDL